MRVGIDLSPLAYGNRTRGIGVYAENLAAALLAQDATNEYMLLTSRGPEEYVIPFPLAQNAKHISIAAPALGRATPLASHQMLLPLYARRLRLDVLHVPAISFNPSMPGMALWQTVPTVVTCHDLMPLHPELALLSHARYRRFYKTQLSACCRAAHLICVSEYTAREVEKKLGVAREKISVIHHGVPARAPQREISDSVRAVTTRAPFLLHVGGDEPQKDQTTVLRAFGLLCRNPAFQHNLILVGKHHGDDMPALEQSTRAARRILRLYQATRADLDALYAQCDVFVFPSLYEGFGLPVLEAMRAGAPVITTNVSALPEIAGDAALYVEPQNAEALARAIRRVLDDERARVQLSEAGERRAQEFTWARAAEMTRAVYAQVLAKRKQDA